MRSKIFIASFALSVIAVSIFNPSAVSYADTDFTSSTALSSQIEEIPAPIRYIDDSSLSQGVEIVVNEGAPGSLTNTKESEQSKDEFGNIVEIPKYTQKVISQPKERVIKRGTRTSEISGISEKIQQQEKDKAAKAAAAAAQAAASKAKKSSRDASTSVSNSSPAGFTSPAENMAYAQSIMSDDNFRCFNNIIQKESGWRTNAQNSSSGAYGIGQALPGSKMASAGSDWRTNGKTQVDWTLSYMNGRYGSPCGAWNFWQSKHWY
jgi:cell pole-organizing protein PopZ